MQSKKITKELEGLRAFLKKTLEKSAEGWECCLEKVSSRRTSARRSFAFFVKTYFPHYIRHSEFSRVHKHIFKIAKNIHSLHAIAAPRGEGKSTIVSKLLPLWLILTERSHYILIVMDSIDQAYPILESIKVELEFNQRLLSDFPDACGMGKVWQMGSIVSKNDVKVQVAGSGKRIRGLTHGAYRPDIVILDDIENDQNIQNPKQRDKIHDWVNKTILPLGGAGEPMGVIFIGTIIHYDGVLNRTLANPAWNGARFAAILTPPANPSLWDRWEELFINKEFSQAEAFYQDHRKEMNKGAALSWSARDLYSLMKIRATIGRDAFASEYQNNPVASDEAIFAGHLTYWLDLPPNLIYFGAVDPSLGKFGEGRDPSAVIVGGFDQKNGVLYIVEANIRKRLPDLLIEDIILMQRRYKCLLWAVESVQFQEFLRTELIKRGAARGVMIPARAVIPHTDKRLRIETLQPYLQNKQILLNPLHKTLIEQLEYYPKAAHDDGADALQMLWALASSASPNRKARATKAYNPTF